MEFESRIQNEANQVGQGEAEGLARTRSGSGVPQRPLTDRVRPQTNNEFGRPERPALERFWPLTDSGRLRRDEAIAERGTAEVVGLRQRLIGRQLGAGIDVRVACLDRLSLPSNETLLLVAQFGHFGMHSLNRDVRFAACRTSVALRILPEVCIANVRTPWELLGEPHPKH